MGFFRNLGRSIRKNPLQAVFGPSWVGAAHNAANGRKMYDLNDPLVASYAAALGAGAGMIGNTGKGTAAASSAGGSSAASGAVRTSAGSQTSQWIPAITAGATTAANIYSQDRTNKQNVQLAREQMAFQERMSNTAHEREYADMIRAGINPTLSGNSSGASTPSGAAANLTAPQLDFPSLASVISLDQAQQKIDIDRAEAMAGISKKGEEEALTKLKQQLAQKGMPRADIEGAASKLLRQWMDDMADKWKNRPGQPYQKGNINIRRRP